MCNTYWKQTCRTAEVMSVSTIWVQRCCDTRYFKILFTHNVLICFHQQPMIVTLCWECQAVYTSSEMTQFEYICRLALSNNLILHSSANSHRKNNFYFMHSNCTDSILNIHFPSVVSRHFKLTKLKNCTVINSSYFTAI